jgi:hypothetical protein
LLNGVPESLRGGQVFSGRANVPNTILRCNINLEQVFFCFGTSCLIKKQAGLLEPDLLLGSPKLDSRGG